MSSHPRRLDGPRLDAASHGPATHLVVFLHGYGANGEDLIALGHEWRRVLPNAAFRSPNAPEVCLGNPYGGRQWFDLTFRDPDELWVGVNRAGPDLDAYLDAELAALGLDDSRLALVGFSQGTMMALHVGLRRAKPPAAIVGYSGLLAGSEHLASQIKVRPPVLLVHGDSDELIPVQAMETARDELAELGVPVEWKICEGLGHGIDSEGLRTAGQFLADRLRAAEALP
jgi:phospholipase/carboxylesterase